jgi:aspartate 1-decarboxylase
VGDLRRPRPGGGRCLNGAAARQGEVGDELILINYQSAVAFPGARVVYCEGNRPARSLDYDPGCLNSAVTSFPVTPV